MLSLTFLPPSKYFHLLDRFYHSTDHTRFTQEIFSGNSSQTFNLNTASLVHQYSINEADQHPGYMYQWVWPNTDITEELISLEEKKARPFLNWGGYNHLEKQFSKTVGWLVYSSSYSNQAQKRNIFLNPWVRSGCPHISSDSESRH